MTLKDMKQLRVCLNAGIRNKGEVKVCEFFMNECSRNLYEWENCVCVCVRERECERVREQKREREREGNRKYFCACALVYYV